MSLTAFWQKCDRTLLFLIVWLKWLDERAQLNQLSNKLVVCQAGFE